MYHLPSSSPRLQSSEGIGWGVSLSFKWRSIHILDDDSLLNIFYYSQPVLLDQDEADHSRILQGGEWGRERWWYKLVHVCRRWRYLVLGSASYLGLRLVCTHGTPVADMLAHSPPLPLIIDYIDQGHGVTTDEEAGIVLAFQQRGRVHRIRLVIPVPELQRLIMAMDGEFPKLEHLYIGPPTKHTTGLVLPETFQAHLRHFVLINFAFPLGSPLLTNTTAASLVTLVLQSIPPSAYFRPNDLFQRLSLIPHLETFIFGFDSPVHNRDVERQLLREFHMTPIALPNLRWLGFKGASDYLEAVLPQITAPLLERLEISFLNQLIFSMPHLQQFMDEAENFNFGNVVLTFHEESLCMNAYPTDGANMYALHMEIGCRHFDWQVSSAAQIINTLGTPCSAVEHLTLKYRGNFNSSEPPNEDDLVQWRELLGSFDNMKTLSVFGGPVGELSFTLISDRGLCLELPPELKELLCPAGRGSSYVGAISSFIDTHQSAGPGHLRFLVHTALPVNRSLQHFISEDVLVDGFLSHTFSPQDAHNFLVLLLKSLDFMRYYSISYLWGVWYIMQNVPHVQRPPPGVPTDNLPLPLDFSIRGAEGTVVPQRRWTPADEVNIRRFVEEAMLQLPVFFVNRNGTVGFLLWDILQGRDHDLHNRDSQAPLGGRSTTHIRINWPGYAHWKRMIPVRDETYSRNPITVGQFMRHVGTSVNNFMNHCLTNGPGADPRWGIGPYGITQRHVKVIGAVHVAAGSWQPIIQLTWFVL